MISLITGAAAVGAEIQPLRKCPDEYPRQMPMVGPERALISVALTAAPTEPNAANIKTRRGGQQDVPPSAASSREQAGLNPAQGGKLQRPRP